MIYNQMVSKHGFDPLRPRVVLADGVITSQEIVVDRIEKLIVSKITAKELAGLAMSLIY